MSKKDKVRGYSYFLRRCSELEIAEDLFDFEMEIGEDLNYSEILTQLEDKLFNNSETIKDIKLKAEAEYQQLILEQHERDLQNKTNERSEEIIKIFDKPKIMGLIGDVNTGKSMLIYHILETLKKENRFKLFTYGLRLNFPNSQQIYSVSEMEQILGSLIIVDELSSLFDLDNRKVKKQIENTLRLINHNNNILILCGTPENFKKFLSAKIDIFFYKKCTIADFINGNRAKNVLISYKGSERGSEMLNLKVDEVIYFDGEHYNKEFIPYYKKYDSKKDNNKIIVPKNVPKNVLKTFREKKVLKNVPKKVEVY